MVPLKEYSLKLVRDGFTDLAEVLRVTMTDEGEEKLCGGCKAVVEEHWTRCPYCLFSLKTSCHACGAFVQKEWKACVQCGVKVQTKKEDDSHSHHSEHSKPKAEVKKDDFEFNFDQIETKSSASAKCPTCLAEVQMDWDNCPYCHTVLN